MDKVKLTQIVKEVQKDRGQFELLYSQIISRVYYWCFTVVGNEAEAKDVTQEVMIRIYNKLNTLKNPENFTSWMYRLVRNCSLNYLRKTKKTEHELLYDEETGESTESLIREERNEHIPHDAYVLKETKQLVQQFVGNLPRRQREVVTLYYLEEYKIEEIAEILDYNSGSVRSRLHAGRKNLETQITEYEEKNNVKLYSLSLLPLLGLILKEYCEEIVQNQNFHFDQKEYDFNDNVTPKNILSLMSIKVLFITLTLLVLALFINETLLEKNVVSTTEKTEYSFTNNVNMYKKIKGNPYIESIIYSSFPTRNAVEVSITLKKNIASEDTKILFNDNEMFFEKKNNEIVVSIGNNGEYTIVIEDEEITFEISTIDENALELVDVYNYGEYLKLNIDGELSQLDFERSYIKYQEKIYQIDNSLKISGNFEGLVEIMIFNKDGQFIEYLITTN